MDKEKDKDSVEGEKNSLFKDARSPKYRKRIFKDRKREAKKNNFYEE